MTEKQRDRMENRHKTYEGFGDKRSASHWARIAGLPRTTFWRYLQEGLTVEEIFKLRGCSYTSENPEARPRKDRQGARMEETRLAAEQLINASGYRVERGSVLVEILGGTRHRVTYNGQPFGTYNYKTDSLQLSGGEGLRLKDPLVEGQQVLRVANGTWELHPRTRIKILART